NPKADAFGNVFATSSKYSTLALNPTTKKFELAKVTAFSKHVAPEHMVRITSRSGREFILTGEHPLPHPNGTSMEKKLAFEASHLLVPSSINIPEKDVKRFDLLEFDVPDLMVRGVRLRKPYRPTAKKLGINYKTFMDFVYRNSVPLSVLREMCVKIPRNAKVGAKRDDKCFPRFLSVDKNLLFLLGLYLAEGYARKKDKLNYQICFTATRNDVRDFIIEKIKKVFKSKPAIQGNSIIICSRLIHALFVEHLHLGTGAHSKSVPNFVFSLPKKKLSAFLSGYFTGDGSVSRANSIEVNCTSVNKKLIDQVAFLLLRFGIKHSVHKSDREINSELILRFYGKPKRLVSYKLRMYGEDAERFIREIGFSLNKQKKAECLLKAWLPVKKQSSRKIIGDVFVDGITERDLLHSDKTTHTYSLTVEPHHNLICSNALAFQCDGDEDSTMLLMDALVNFSKKFLPEARGGTMDASLVLTVTINPKEVDDEVHAMEVCSSYQLEFYEAAMNFASPSEVKIEKISERLGKDEQYSNIRFTHHSSSIQNAPVKTRYVELKTMKEKVEAQFALCSKIRAVDVRDAAERLILSHFIPDLYGNMRSFSRQSFRCIKCNRKYRRVPLLGKCPACGDKLVLTINKGGIEKYLKISNEIADRYDLPLYLKQRLALLEKEIASVFEDETSKQFSLEQFM
ncbi:MAG: LAGLIDADG family homing endonuclease, partial [Candidatus Micrarchaeota archaeon]